jgi:four helix bundle protein
MKVTRFEDLECWQQARVLARMVYEAVNASPMWRKDHRLAGQVQDAAGSVMPNIAEGFARRSNREFTQFLFIGLASAAEVQSRLYIATDQGYITEETFCRIYDQAEKVSQVISGLIRYLRTRQTKQTPQTR